MINAIPPYRSQRLPAVPRLRAFDRHLSSKGNLSFAVSILLAASFLVISYGFFVKFAFLGHQSLWGDEILTSQFSDRTLSISQLWRRFWQNDAHPPLYYAVLHYWLYMFPTTDEVSLRSLSALFAGSTSVAALFAYRRFLAWPTHLFFATVLSCNFGLIYYAQEARNYAMAFLLSLLLLASLMVVWNHLRNSRLLSTPAMVFCSICGILLSETHLFGYFYTISCFSTILALLIIYRCRNWGTFLGFSVLTGAVATLWPLWALTHFSTMKESNGLAWFNDYMDPNLLTKLTAWLLFGNPYALALAISLGVAASLAAYRRGRFGVPDSVWVALAPSVLVILIAITISVFVMPILSHRNFFVLFPSIYFVIAVFLGAHMSPRNVLMISPIIGAIFLWPSLNDFYDVYKTQWRESAAYIQEERGCSHGSIRVFPRVALEHSGYLRQSITLLGARVEGWEDGRVRDQVPTATDLRVALLEATQRVENDCGVLLWVVPSAWLIKDPDHWNVPDNVKMVQFFDAIVFVRNREMARDTAVDRNRIGE